MKKRSKKLLIAGCVLCHAGAQGGTVLSRIRQTNTLQCGVIAERDDWGKADQHGDLSAFDSEICRAVAASLSVKPVIARYATEEAGLRAVQQAKIDLAVGVTPTPGTVRFGPTIFFDAIAILGRTGGPICAADGSDAESLLSLSLTRPGATGTLFSFQEEGEMESALLTGHCTGLAATLSRLGQIRAAYGGKLANLPIAAARLGIIPVAAATAGPDAEFGAIADWTIHALVQAEASGITQTGVRTWRDTGNIVTERLLGRAGNAAAALGLKPDWSTTLIATVGNYGEIYARTVNLPRAENALWTNGGLMVPAPVQ